MFDCEKDREPRRVFAVLWSAVFLFRLWFISTLPLSGDEVYHWEWARHPAFGYYDHPGLTAYAILFFVRLLGSSTEFSVRLPALLFLSGASWVAYALAARAARDCGASGRAAERAGFLAGFLLLVTPIYAVFAVYISTDPPVIFFWLLALYGFYRALWGGGWGAWIGAGAAFGLAMMSKFLAFPMAISLGLFVLISPRHRRWLARPHPYVAAAVALAIFSPFLWWNATHEWATFFFNFVYRQKGRSFAPLHSLEFMLSQAGALSPGLWAFALAALAWALLDWRRRQNATSLYLGLSAIVPLVYFLYTSFQRRVGLHWPAPAWTGALVYLAVRWGSPSVFQGNRPGFGAESAALLPASGLPRGARVSLAVCVGITVLLHAVVHLPPIEIRPFWNDSDANAIIRASDQFERYGWREMGARVKELTDGLTEEQRGEGGERGVFLITGQYGLSAAVSFYTPGQPYSHLWSPRRAHGENYRFWDRFEELAGQDAVFIAKNEDYVNFSLPSLREHFRKVEEPERFAVLWRGQKVREFFFVRCRRFDGRTPRF